MWLKWICITFCFIETFGSSSVPMRSKRGAAVYATYQTQAGQGSNIFALNSNNPEPFIKYLGGGGGSSSTGAFDTGYLNSFNQHQQGSSGTTNSFAPSLSTTSRPATSSGWTPSSEPTNGNNGHSISPTALLEAAQASFGAQTELFNALSTGARPSSYKGGPTNY